MFVSIGAIAHLGTPYTRCGQLELALLAVWLRKLVCLIQLKFVTFIAPYFFRFLFAFSAFFHLSSVGHFGYEQLQSSMLEFAPRS